MRPRRLALALGLILLTSGCLGLGGSEGELTQTSTQGEEAGSATGPEPIQRSFEDAATVGLPVFDPMGATGVKAEFVWTSYQNGANGTWLLGYEIEVPEGYEDLTVEAAADDDGTVPDYDLYVFDADGQMLGESFNEGTSEEVVIHDLDPGTYVAVVYYFAGANDPVTTDVTIR